MDGLRKKHHSPADYTISTPMLTQCPSCKTMFRITTEQLEAMNGVVRCGFCYGTFNALESLRNETSATASTPSSFEKNQVIEDESESIPAFETLAEGAADDNYPDDFIFNDDNFDKNSLDLSTFEPEAKAEDDPFAQWREHGKDPFAKRGKSSSDNELPATDINPKLTVDQPHTTINKSKNKKSADYFHEVDQVLMPGYNKHKSQASESPFASLTKSFSKLKANTRNGTPNLKNTNIAGSHGVGTLKTNWQFSTLAWILAILFLIGLILAQYSYFMRNDLAKYPAVRPWLEKLCTVAGCEIPLAKDPTRITLVSRDIRTHPKEKGALLVKATIVNDAPFTQPFPELKLVLTDINNRVVATRQFPPQEYLASTAINIGAGMNPKIHYDFQLEMVDPDKNAVGFEFHFL